MVRPKPPELLLLTSSDEAEQQFYEALQSGDIDKLMAVWADDEDISCVHPGGPRILGAAAIRAAFESMFANGPIRAHPEKVRRVTAQGCVTHSLVERVRVMTNEGAQQAWVLVTNVYVNTALGWRMVAHHASPGSLQELPEVGETPSVLH